MGICFITFAYYYDNDYYCIMKWVYITVDFSGAIKHVGLLREVCSLEGFSYSGVRKKAVVLGYPLSYRSRVIYKARVRR